MCNRVNINVGLQIFSADFYDCDFADSIIKQLPMTVAMSETDNAEYFVPLAQKVTGISDSSKHIMPGDITLYKKQSLSIFFDCQDTSIEYTKIGHISNPDDLLIALNKSSGSVTFSLAN